MKRTDLAYVAGIIDGEGSISLYPPCKGRRGLKISVQVGNTNEWLIQWLRFIFGGYIYTIPPRKNCKPVHSWSVSYQQALGVLQAVYPYLRLKKPQAEIAINFLKMRHHKGRHLTDGELAIGEAQRILMASLNKKGERL